jgi:hypothetical protein
MGPVENVSEFTADASPMGEVAAGAVPPIPVKLEVTMLPRPRLEQLYEELQLIEVDATALPSIPAYPVDRRIPIATKRYLSALNRFHSRPVTELDDASKLSYGVQIVTDVYFLTGLKFTTDLPVDFPEFQTRAQFGIFSVHDSRTILAFDVCSTAYLESQPLEFKFKAAIQAQAIDPAVTVPYFFYLFTDLISWDLCVVLNRTRIVYLPGIFQLDIDVLESVSHCLERIAAFATFAEMEVCRANKLTVPNFASPVVVVPSEPVCSLRFTITPSLSDVTECDADQTIG